MKRFIKQTLLFSLILIFSFSLYAIILEDNCTCCEHLRLNNITLTGDDYVSFRGNYTIEEIQAINSNATCAVLFQDNKSENLLPPKNLVVHIVDNNVLLSWEAPESNPLGYIIFRNNILLTPDIVTSTEILIPELQPGTYIFCVRSVYPEGNSEPACVELIISPPISDIDDNILPLKTELIGNFPNPFNPETTILFSLEKTGIVIFEVFNIKGQKIRTLVNESMDAGHHQVLWNGTDDFGRNVSSGIYFYRINAGSESLTKRMLLLK